MEDGALAGTATYSIATGTVPQNWVLPDAVTSGVTFLIPVHPQWKSGVCYVTVLYSVDGTTAGNIMWRIRSFGFQEATAFAASSGNSVTKAAPTTAGTLHELELTDSATGVEYPVVAQGNIALRLHIERLGGNAGDTNTDDVLVHGAIVRYQEGRHQL